MRWIYVLSGEFGIFGPAFTISELLMATRSVSLNKLRQVCSLFHCYRHYRRLVLKDIGADLTAELNYITKTIKHHPKNYQVWYVLLCRLLNFGAVLCVIFFTAIIFVCVLHVCISIIFLKLYSHILCLWSFHWKSENLIFKSGYGFVPNKQEKSH